MERGSSDNCVGGRRSKEWSPLLVVGEWYDPSADVSVEI